MLFEVEEQPEIGSVTVRLKEYGLPKKRNVLSFPKTVSVGVILSSISFHLRSRPLTSVGVSIIDTSPELHIDVLPEEDITG